MVWIDVQRLFLVISGALRQSLSGEILNPATGAAFTDAERVDAAVTLMLLAGTSTACLWLPACRLSCGCRNGLLAAAAAAGPPTGVGGAAGICSLPENCSHVGHDAWHKQVVVVPLLTGELLDGVVASLYAEVFLWLSFSQSAA